MTNLIDKIKGDMDVALKAGDGVAVSTLRLLISGIQNAQIEKREDLDDGEVLDIIRRDVKKHKESIEAFEKGERGDLVKKEAEELEVLRKYLPPQMPKEEIIKVVDQIVTETGASTIADMGKVMGQVMAKVGSQADGGMVSQIVKQKLSA